MWGDPLQEQAKLTVKYKAEIFSSILSARSRKSNIYKNLDICALENKIHSFTAAVMKGYARANSDENPTEITFNVLETSPRTRPLLRPKKLNSSGE